LYQTYTRYKLLKLGYMGLVSFITHSVLSGVENTEQHAVGETID
jgi:hypothetical protein